MKNNPIKSIALFISNHLSYRRRSDLDTNKSKELDLSFIEILMSKKQILLWGAFIAILV